MADHGRHKVTSTKGKRKVYTVMSEFKRGNLHSGRGSRVVRDRQQAIAIALSEGRKTMRKVR